METATKAPKQCLVFSLNLCHVPLMERWWRRLTETYVATRAHWNVSVCSQVKRILLLSLIRLEQHFCCYLLLCTLLCRCVGVDTPRPLLTSKQYSCPRMLEWTGLMMASSSRVRSSASAALLGDSKDSWEWDSLKLCIKRVLGGVIAVVRSAEGFYWVALLFSDVERRKKELWVGIKMALALKLRATASCLFKFWTTAIRGLLTHPHYEYLLWGRGDQEGEVFWLFHMFTVNLTWLSFNQNFLLYRGRTGLIFINTKTAAGTFSSSRFSS